MLVMSIIKKDLVSMKEAFFLSLCGLQNYKKQECDFETAGVRLLIPYLSEEGDGFIVSMSGTISYFSY